MSVLLRPSNLISHQPASVRSCIGQPSYDHATQVRQWTSSDDGRIKMLKDPKTDTESEG